MSGVDFKITKNEIGIRLKGIVNGLNKLPAEATQEFKTLTPIKTGNARRQTQLQNKRTIVADYPYAERLDNGYSKQAPQGMTKPFEAWMEKRMNELLGK